MRIESGLEKEISLKVSAFLSEQLGEIQCESTTYITDDLLTLYIRNCFTQAEKSFVKNPDNYRKIADFKERQLDATKPALKVIFEKLTGSEVEEIYSLFTQDGDRFFIVNLQREIPAERKHRKYKAPNEPARQSGY